MSQPSPTEPAFTDTMQIGIVVPDLDAAIRTYQEVYGIGPWEIVELGPDDAEDARIYGRPVEWRSRAALAMVGRVQWELIQPLDTTACSRAFSPNAVAACTTSRSPHQTSGERCKARHYAATNPS
jgi:hypothetical protein